MVWTGASTFVRGALLILAAVALTAAVFQTRTRHAPDRQSSAQPLAFPLAQAETPVEGVPQRSPAGPPSAQPPPRAQAIPDADRELALTLVPGLLEMGATVMAMGADDDGRAVLAAVNGMRRQAGLPPFEQMDQAVADYVDIALEQHRERQANILRIQIALDALGFDPGPVDSLLGPRTTQAIRRYQERAGMPATGALTDEQIDALEMLSFDRTARRRPAR
jgi:hypothetical protein